jgi:spermidine synthase
MQLPRDKSAKINLIVFSGLALYAESVLIRWMGAEIRMFAYLKNFTLLAAFLGLGIGMLRQRRTLFSWLLPSLMSLLTLALVFSAQLRLTRLFFPDSGITQWAGSLNSPSLVPAARGTPLIGAILRAFSDSAVPWVLGVMAFVAGAILFVVVVLIFAHLGQRIGELLRAVQPPLSAYTLNLLGSLFGTLLYVVLVWLALPPWVWFAPIFACLVYFSDHRIRDGLVLGVALVAAFVMGNTASVVWSPYYRISLSPEYGDAYQRSVDHDFHQDALDLRPAAVQKYPELAGPLAYYNLPYQIAPSCKRALVVGAGTGNDVAAALRAGCQSIDAVEIDPLIVRLGQRLHPEHPYQSERVHIFVNDGRAYFHQALAAGKTYDLIVFGLVDSQTALSVVSSLRLEFLLYSLESFREARSLLDQQNGLLVVGFSVGWRDWVSRRLYNTLGAAFEQPPLAVKPSTYVGVLSFVAGPASATARQKLLGLPAATDWTQNVAGADIGLVRDNWPFLYYNPHTIPFVYLGSLLLVIVFGCFTIRRAAGNIGSGLRVGISWPLFFMGAAFLLVETKNISQLAILFGATWVTNMVVFVSVFLVAILANLLVARKPVTNLPTLYAWLGMSLLLSYFIPFSDLTRLPFFPRAAVGGLVTALPVLFSSLIFAKMFKETELADAGLGSNILGGLLGGGLEALTMFTGIRSMALVAIGIYGVSWLAYVAQHREVVPSAPASLQRD